MSTLAKPTSRPEPGRPTPLPRRTLLILDSRAVYPDHYPLPESARPAGVVQVPGLELPTPGESRPELRRALWPLLDAEGALQDVILCGHSESTRSRRLPSLDLDEHLALQRAHLQLYPQLDRRIRAGELRVHLWVYEALRKGWRDLDLGGTLYARLDRIPRLGMPPSSLVPTTRKAA